MAKSRAKSAGKARSSPREFKPEMIDGSLGGRLGISSEFDDEWKYLMIQSLDGTVADADEVLDALLEHGHIGAARRNVGKALFMGKIPKPLGSWGMLVQLSGQPWLYLIGDGLRDEWAKELAGRLGARTLMIGGEGKSDTRFAVAYERMLELANFASSPEMAADGNGDHVVKQFSKTAGMRIRGRRFPVAWLKQFSSCPRAHNALAREMNAYCPVLMRTSSERGDAAEIYGADHGEFEPADFERIDIVTFGDPTTLAPTRASYDLTKAIEKGDAAGVRKAIRAGADLRYQPADSRSPLESTLALLRSFDDDDPTKASRQLDILAALLDAGADPDPPGKEPAIHAVLQFSENEDEQTIVRQVELLLDHGADSNAVGTFFRGVGETPLHRAASNGWLAVVKLLVSRGADVSKRNADGKTALQQTSEQLKKLTSELNGMRSRKKSRSKQQQMLDVFAQLYAAELDGEREALQAMQDFLMSAEAGKADVSDIREVAERSSRKRKEEKDNHEALLRTRTTALAKMLQLL